MTEETKKADDQPTTTAIVYRLASEVSKDINPIPRQAVVSNAFEPEDEYLQYYLGAVRDIGAILPPYNLKTLDRLVQENNSLGPCVEAMVTNIDGTGFDIAQDTGDALDRPPQKPHEDPSIDALWDFFKEPYPGMSFVTLRKSVRRDLERTGNGYMEILRNTKNNIVFARHVDAKMMRLVKLDEAVPVDMAVTRKGETVSMKLMQRQRRYVQYVNGIGIVYFKDFGVTRDLNKKTGKWAQPGQRLKANERATEIIHFTVLPDAHTPYGVPRWINQLPSVLGSRKAEEFNMEFFDNGGVPPVMIILQGGVLSNETRRMIEQKVGGPATKKNRVQVFEMEPSGGTLDSPGASKVIVERFGADRQHDSMFENYDNKCEVRVRRSFRLPPIFVGQAADYSFATAFASYTVAEAQVFRPERDEFDEVVSIKLIPALGYPGYKIISKAMTIEDATLRLQGLEVALLTKQVDAADVLNEINNTVGTKLKVSLSKPDPDLLPLQLASIAAQAKPQEAPGTSKAGASKATATKGGASAQQPIGLRIDAESGPPDKIEPREPGSTAVVRPPTVRKGEEVVIEVDPVELAAQYYLANNAGNEAAVVALRVVIESLDDEMTEEFELALRDLQLSARPQAAA